MGKSVLAKKRRALGDALGGSPMRLGTLIPPLQCLLTGPTGFPAVLANGIVLFSLRDCFPTDRADGPVLRLGRWRTLWRALASPGGLSGLSLGVSLGHRSLAFLGRLGRSLDSSVHVEADVPVPVDDHKVADLPAVVVGDARDLEAGVRIAFQDFLPAVLLTFGIKLVVCQFDVNEGAGILLGGPLSGHAAGARLFF